MYEYFMIILNFFHENYFLYESLVRAEYGGIRFRHAGQKTPDC